MTQKLQAIRFIVLGGFMALALNLIAPSIVLAHAGHDGQGGIEVATTLQVAGVVALLGGGYFIIRRMARRHDGEPFDQAKPFSHRAEPN